MWNHEKKPTANRRESRKPSACSQNRICYSSLEHGGPYRPAGSSLIGTVRANPVGAPAPSVRKKECFCSSIIGSGVATKLTTLAEQTEGLRVGGSDKKKSGPWSWWAGL